MDVKDYHFMHVKKLSLNAIVGYVITESQMGTVHLRAMLVSESREKMVGCQKKLIKMNSFSIVIFIIF